MSDIQPPQFTGEFLVPGRSPERMQADHYERYFFACRFAQGQRVLDIACGSGYSAPMFMAAGASSYQGVDLKPELIEAARGQYGGPGVEFSVGDITEYRSEKPFDLVCCFETIEHVPAYGSAIENLGRLVAPGGTLLISSPNRPVTSPRARALSDKPANPFHTQEFTPGELSTELLAAGFVSDPEEVYGQRRSFMPFHPLMKAVYKAVVGNPKKKASPVVTPSDQRTPRYFLLRANRPAA